MKKSLGFLFFVIMQATGVLHAMEFDAWNVFTGQFRSAPITPVPKISAYDQSRDLRAVKKIARQSADGIGLWPSVGYDFSTDRTWVARVDGKTVGFVNYAMLDDIAQKKMVRGKIHLLAVGQKSRRQGIGRLLLEASLRDMAHNNVCCAHLDVFRDNLSAIRLYSSMGFVCKGATDDGELVHMRRANVPAYRTNNLPSPLLTKICSFLSRLF